jgi:hypothetical protein
VKDLREFTLHFPYNEDQKNTHWVGVSIFGAKHEFELYNGKAIYDSLNKFVGPLQSYWDAIQTELLGRTAAVPFARVFAGGKRVVSNPRQSDTTSCGLLVLMWFLCSGARDAQQAHVPYFRARWLLHFAQKLEKLGPSQSARK